MELNKKNKISTRYGDIVVSEDENGAINVTFSSDYTVVTEMKSSNSLAFHCIEPR